MLIVDWRSVNSSHPGIVSRNQTGLGIVTRPDATPRPGWWRRSWCYDGFVVPFHQHDLFCRVKSAVVSSVICTPHLCARFEWHTMDPIGSNDACCSYFAVSKRRKWRRDVKKLSNIMTWSLGCSIHLSTSLFTTKVPKGWYWGLSVERPKYNWLWFTTLAICSGQTHFL